MQKHHGFTLAETLLTLVVLGIVMAYTIPAVITKQRSRDLVASYQKAINVLNNAYASYYNSPPADKSSSGQKKYAQTQYGSNGETLDAQGNPESDDNPVVKFDWVDDGNRYEIGTDGKLDNVYRLLEKVFTKHMNVVNIKGVSSSKVIYYTIATDTKSLYDYTTFDYCTKETTPIEYFYTSDGIRYCISYDKIENNPKFGEDTFGVIWVDTNGEKRPNKAFRNTGTASDPSYMGEILPITILKDRFVPGHPTKDEYNNAAQDLFFNRT